MKNFDMKVFVKELVDFASSKHVKTRVKHLRLMLIKPDEYNNEINTSMRMRDARLVLDFVKKAVRSSDVFKSTGFEVDLTDERVFSALLFAFGNSALRGKNKEAILNRIYSKEYEKERYLPFMSYLGLREFNILKTRYSNFRAFCNYQRIFRQCFWLYHDEFHRNQGRINTDLSCTFDKFDRLLKSDLAEIEAKACCFIIFGKSVEIKR